MPKTLPLLQPIQLKESLFEMDGISEQTIQQHQAMYERYIKRYNDIANLLDQVNRDPDRASSTYSPLRVLKIEMTYALGGVRNHELYFEQLGGEGGKPRGGLASQIKEWFGSFEEWAIDLTSTALSSRGWAWLAWDREGQYLYNYLGDVNNTFPVWNAAPLIALDVYEHAYFLDFKQDRRAYINAFLENLDWEVITQRFEAATR
ncbi:MAG TPA: Fe-Mn family superoxide dismutase [Ktedonobacterales bacterium]|jgi:Fe-Mn family superoxide dismutase